ncbi:MAG: efflux RND transporter periplasmic adaptor subunit [Proteobacteria bacterium]|nr:efflux RND transporter periplasmic adaptor subunit [Pseudomonadota bacterium]MBS0494429.1 efflux RND transporter periplasmic adaptor subunit [Pseudomonadota bacterium]
MKQPLAMMLAAALAIGMLPAPNAYAAEDGASVLVQTASPVRKPMARRLAGYGTVVAGADAVTVVSVPRSGQVTRLAVAPGQRVERGAALLDFSTDPAALAAYRQAQTAVQTAQDDLARMQQMAQQQLATQTQLAAARKTLADAQAGLAALQAQGSGRSAQTLTAPFDAVVLAVNTKEGDLVAARSAVVQLARLASLGIAMGVGAQDLYRVRAGMPVRLVPVFGGSPVSGLVATLQAVVDPATRLVNVIVRPDCRGPCDSLLPGAQFRGEIELDRPTLWVVPRSAVLTDGQGAYVFQVKDGRARRVPVSVAAQTQTETGIEGDIDPQRKLVVTGNYELTDGAAVREARP